MASADGKVSQESRFRTGVMLGSRRWLRWCSAVTLVLFSNLAVEGYLWAQAIEMERQQREAMRQQLTSLLIGIDERAGNPTAPQTVPDALSELLGALAAAQATDQELRYSPRTFAPVWRGAERVREQAQQLTESLDSRRDTIRDLGLGRSVLARHDRFASELEKRLSRVLSAVEQLQRVLELNRLDEADERGAELRELLAELRRPDVPGAGLADEELAHRSPVVRPSPRSHEAAERLAAQPPQAADLVTGGETAVTSEMAALAMDLEHDPGRLFWWVRNHIDLLPTYGLVQGAGETLASRQGNPVDQAALLVALLRTANVPARYVHGEVEIPAEELASWVGSESVDEAVELLSRNGVATEVVPSGGGFGAVRLEHTWVRAWIDYAPYRGLVKSDGDRWVDLDPSFKEISVQRQRDVATEIGVDPVNFLRQIRNQSTVNDAEGWVTHLPEGFITHTIDLWGGDVESYAAANGFTNETLFGRRAVVAEDLKVLPLSLPYEVIAEHGSAAQPAASLETAVNMTLRLEDGTPLLSHATTVTELAGARVSVTFEPETPDDGAVLEAFRTEAAFPVYLVSVTPRLLVNGVERAVGQPVGMGVTLDLETELNGPLFERERSHHPVVAGAHGVLTFDLQGVTRRNLYERLGGLRAVREQLESGAVGDVDEVLGEALHVIGLSYWHQLDGLDQLAGGALGVRVVRQASQLVAACEPAVTTLLGAPFEADGARFSLAVGRDALTTLAIGDASSTAEQQLHTVAALTASVLQHSMLEQTLGGQGISTVRLLQAASSVGSRVYTFEGSSPATIDAALAGLDPVLTQTVRDSVNAGRRVTVSAQASEYGGFTGVGWSAFDPATGSAGMFIDRTRAAGLRLLDDGGLLPAELLLGASAAAYLPLVTPGIQWIELAEPIIEETGFRYVPAVSSIAHWFADAGELDNAAFLAAGIALSGPISVIASRPSIGQVAVVPEVFSPNGDSVKDTATITARISRESTWRVDLLDDSQVVVATFSGEGQEIDEVWDGLRDGGGLAAEGRYTVRINATAVGLDTPAFPAEERLILDLTPPSTEILMPAAGSTVQGFVSVIGTAEDANFAEYTLAVGAGASPASWETLRQGTDLVIDNSLGIFDGPKYANGDYTFRLQASDRAGNGSEAQQSIILDDPENDLEAPVVALQLPPDGAAISGPFTIQAHATDNQEVTLVELLVDGEILHEYHSASADDLYSIDLDSVTLSNGPHTVSAVAVDARGNEGRDERTISTSNAVAEFIVNPNPFSPNGDGIDDTTSLSATLEPADGWTLEITSSGGTVLRTFTGSGGAVLRSWDGRDGNGSLQDTAEYTATLTTTAGAAASIPIMLERTNQPPHVEITSPEELERVYTEVEVRGTVTDTDLDHWTLELRRLNSDSATTIGSGTHRVLGGVLGKLDATNLRNDPYELLLTAFDTEGSGVQIVRQVIVSGELKIGNIRFSQVDMSIPVVGLPVTVSRGYDSLDRHNLGDFGYGWRLDIGDIDLDDGSNYELAYVDGSPTGQEARVDGNRDITVTLQDGRRSTFYFRVAERPYGYFRYKVWWEAEPGVYDVIGPIGQHHIIAMPRLDPYWNGGTLDEGMDGYDMPGYILTTKEGIQYVIEKPVVYQSPNPFLASFEGGESRWASALYGRPELSKIIDRNGNELRFEDDGIFHSNGVGIEIERDPVTNLITRITDPDGGDVRYQYDAELNLQFVTDQLDGVTTFVYSTDHLLQEIITPDGTSPVVFQLDERGRVVGFTDPEGKAITLHHNTDQHQEVVTDRSGNPTIYTYDERGNITSVTNALGYTKRYEFDESGNETKVIDESGNETLHTYDERGNQTSTTDPLGTVSRRTYDEHGNLLVEIDGLGHRTQYSYDERGNLTMLTDRLGNQTVYRYDESGNRLSETDALGNTTAYEYDPSGHLVGFSDPLGNETVFSYDGRGNVLSIRKPHPPGYAPEDYTSRFSYSANNQLESITSPDGSSRHFLYDAYGRLLETRDQDGHVLERHAYALNGAKISEEDRFGGVVYEDLTPLGEPGTIRDVFGRDTTISYNAVGQVSSMSSGSDYSRYAYDPTGQESDADYGNGFSVATRHDAAQRWVEQTWADGYSVGRDFDRGGNFQTWTKNGEPVLVLRHDAERQTTAVTGPDGNATVYEYDNAGRLTRATAANGSQTRYIRDAAGRVVETVDALGYSTKAGYFPDGSIAWHENELGRRWTYEYGPDWVEITDPINRTRRIEHGPEGEPRRVVNPDGSVLEVQYVPGSPQGETRDYPIRYVYESGKVRRFSYNDSGQLVMATDLSGAEYTYLYDGPFLSSVVSPSGETVLEYSYDGEGNVVRREYADGASWSYTFGLNIEPVSSRTPVGDEFAFSYDIDENLISRKTGVRTDTFAWDKDGQLSAANHESFQTTYQYSDGLLSSMNRSDGSRIEYERDSLGRVVMLVVTPSDPVWNYSVEYEYDGAGNLTTVRDPIGGVTTFEYNEANQRIGRVLPNGVVTEWSYSDRDFIQRVVHRDGDGQTIASRTYARGLCGAPDVITREDGSRVEVEYDDALRIVEERYYGPSGNIEEQRSYSYDAAGNRLQRVTSEGVFSYNYDPGFQLVQVDNETSPVESYEHDGAGRVSSVLRNGLSQDLDYTADDRLSSVVDGLGQQITYQYDAEGRWVSSGGLFHREFLVAPEANGGLDSIHYVSESLTSSWTGYVHASGRPLLRFGSDGVVYYLADALGSVIALVDSESDVVSRYEYDSFGNLFTSDPSSGVPAAAGGGFRFHGAWFEGSTGFYHMRARQYDPVTGRFLTKDPIEPDLLEPESSHPYMFAYGNPRFFVDPTGTMSLTELNGTMTINNILQRIRTVAVHEAKEKIREELGEAITNYIVRQVTGRLELRLEKIFSDPRFRELSDNVARGNYLEYLTAKILCRIFKNSNWLWFEPRIQVRSGRPLDNGANCHERCGPGYGSPASGGFRGESFPDFLIRQRPPTSWPTKTFITGEVKLGIGTFRRKWSGSQAHQWKAIWKHARKRGYLPHVVVTVALNAGKKADRRWLKRQFRRRKVLGVALILAGQSFWVGS